MEDVKNLIRVLVKAAQLQLDTVILAESLIQTSGSAKTENVFNFMDSNKDIKIYFPTKKIIIDKGSSVAPDEDVKQTSNNPQIQETSTVKGVSRAEIVSTTKYYHHGGTESTTEVVVNYDQKVHDLTTTIQGEIKESLQPSMETFTTVSIPTPYHYTTSEGEGTKTFETEGGIQYFSTSTTEIVTVTEKPTEGVERKETVLNNTEEPDSQFELTTNIKEHATSDTSTQPGLFRSESTTTLPIAESTHNGTQRINQMEFESIPTLSTIETTPHFMIGSTNYTNNLKTDEVILGSRETSYETGIEENSTTTQPVAVSANDVSSVHFSTMSTLEKELNSTWANSYGTISENTTDLTTSVVQELLQSTNTEFYKVSSEETLARDITPDKESHTHDEVIPQVVRKGRHNEKYSPDIHLYSTMPSISTNNIVSANSPEMKKQNEEVVEQNIVEKSNYDDFKTYEIVDNKIDENIITELIDTKHDKGRMTFYEGKFNSNLTRNLKKYKPTKKSELSFSTDSIKAAMDSGKIQILNQKMEIRPVRVISRRSLGKVSRDFHIYF